MITVDRGPVWTVTLDRPERANALSADLVEALHGALDEADRYGPRTLVLRGNRRHFAAGFDLGGLDRETDATLAWRFLRIGALLERLLAAPYTTVAVAEGAAVGAGADLVLACDHRLVAHGVTLRFPGSAFGVALGSVRRAELGSPDAFVTGTPVESAHMTLSSDGDSTRIPHDSAAEWAALARSVAEPGLHQRLTAYAGRTLPTRKQKELA